MISAAVTPAAAARSLRGMSRSVTILVEAERRTRVLCLLNRLSFHLFTTEKREKLPFPSLLAVVDDMVHGQRSVYTDRERVIRGVEGILRA